MKTINITKEDKTIVEIKVIDYFKVAKKEFVLYEQGASADTRKIYLAKLDGKTLLNVDAEDAQKLQSIIRVLLTKEKSVKELKKLDYKKLSADKLTEGIEENSYRMISLTNEQYEDLVSEPVKEEKNKSNKILYVFLVLLLLAIAVVAYLTFFKKEEQQQPINYTITFVTNSTNQVGAMNVAKDNTIDLSKIVPERLGYIFTGWYTDSKLQNPVEKIYKPISNVTLYAGWKEIPVCTDECEPGNLANLTDGSTWAVISSDEETNTITLLAPICSSEMAFDNSTECKNGTCSNDYNKSQVKEYLEEEYLEGLGDLQPLIKEVRLVTVDEINILLEIDDIKEWLLNSKTCANNNWWTMTPYEKDQYFTVGIDGTIEPSTEEQADKTGLSSNVYGIRPVIVIDKSAIIN